MTKSNMKLATFRIEDSIWQSFIKKAKSNNTNASDLIKAFINNYLDDSIDSNIDTKLDNIDSIDKIDDIDNGIDASIDNLEKDIIALRVSVNEVSINVDNRLNLTSEKINQLEQSNFELHSQNKKLSSDNELLRVNIDQLFQMVHNLIESNNNPIFPESGEIPINQLNDNQLIDSDIDEHIDNNIDADLENENKELDYQDLSIKQLKMKLDQLGIKYKAKALKSELITQLKSYQN